MSAFTAPYSIQNISPLVIGGAVFNTQYESDPHQLPVQQIIETAFSSGINAIDTSPYYGPSELIIGSALALLGVARHKYYLCTKAGRYGVDKFDYSPQTVSRSVATSLERLKTTYLDLVCMHDIEFVEEADVYQALVELARLKRQGLIRNIGISGYPVALLYRVAQGAQAHGLIGPLDAVMLYANGCIQNTRLFDVDFGACGVKKVLNGSILSMSLLRSGPTHAFHPGSRELKEAVREIAEWVAESGQELASVSMRYVFSKWLFRGGWSGERLVVVGVALVAELREALTEAEALCPDDAANDLLFSEIQQRLGNRFNEVWHSGR